MHAHKADDRTGSGDDEVSRDLSKEDTQPLMDVWQPLWSASYNRESPTCVIHAVHDGKRVVAGVSSG